MAETLMNQIVNGNWNPNLWHSDRWQVTFSNIPDLPDTSLMKYFDLTVRSVVIPDYNITEVFSDFRGFRIRHPVVEKINADLSQIQVEFKLSEDMKNYLYLFEWMRSMRTGDAVPEDLIRKYTVKNISILILDNQKRNIATLMFTECFLLTLSSLSLEMGGSDEVSFTANFSYEEIKYLTKGITT